MRQKVSIFAERWRRRCACLLTGRQQQQWVTAQGCAFDDDEGDGEGKLQQKEIKSCVVHAKFEVDDLTIRNLVSKNDNA